MATQQIQSRRKTGIRANVARPLLDARQRYWREQFRHEPYYMEGQAFDAYEPAYRLGSAARDEYHDRPFAEIEDRLRMQYEAYPQAQRTLDWADARDAVRAAWERERHVEPGDGSLHRRVPSH